MDTEAPAAASEQAIAPAIEQQTPAEVAKDEPIDLDAAPEAEATAEAEEQTPDEGDEPEEGQEDEGEGQPEAPEMVTLEIDGKAYELPKELEGKFLMQADYTRKTQEVAELRKVAEQQQAEAAQLYQSGQEFIQANAALMNVDAALQQFQQTDWNRLEQEDPISAMSQWRQFQQLQAQRTQIAQYLENDRNQRTAQAERDIANRLGETREFAVKNIPGWNDEMDAKVVQFAEEVGFKRDQLAAAMNPAIYRMLHLAWVGSQAVQKQAAAPKPAGPAPKPLKTVSAKSSPAVTKSPEDMSMSEYVAWRKAGQNRR